VRRDFQRPRVRPSVSLEHHLVAFDQDFERLVDETRLSSDLFNRSCKERSLASWRRLWNKDDQACVKRLPPIKAAEVDGVVGDKDEIALHDPRHQIVVLGRRQPEIIDVVRLVTGAMRHLGQRGVQALVDEEPQPLLATAALASGSPPMGRREVEVTLNP
jgi:hypothetical protein